MSFDQSIAMNKQLPSEEIATPIGELIADPLSLMLGTGFMRFKSPTGLCGLVRRVSGGIEILAIDAHPLGKGQFREFIKECKEHYDSVLILEVFNPFLPEVLKRYGFVDWSGERDQELLEGMIWRHHDRT